MSGSESSNETDVVASVEGEVSFDSAEEALENLVQIKEISFSDTYTERDTELDTEEGEGLSITFYHEDLPNYLHLSTNDDNTLNINLMLSDEYVNKYISIMESLCDIIHPIEITEMSLRKDYEIPFNQLSLPIDEDANLNISGIRFERENRDHILQKRDDDSVTLFVRRDLEITLEGDVVDIVGEEIDYSNALVEELA